MRLLYSTIVFFSSCLARLVSFFNPKWKAWFAARKHINSSKTKKQKIIIHCASHGEYEQTKLLARRLKENGYYVVISFFSLSGQELIREEEENYDELLFLPLDLKSKMRSFIHEQAPALFIFNKYEYWYNLIFVLEEKNIPFIFINVNTDKDSKYFKWPIRSLHKSILQSKRFFVNNSDSKLALEHFGVPQQNIESLADSRIASVLYEKTRQIEIPSLKAISKEVIIYASVHRSDMAIIQSGTKAFPQMCHIVVPHEVHADNIAFFLDALPSSFSTSLENVSDKKPYLLVDSIGKLKHMYKYARIAYIGGGFDNSIHNTLEAIIEDVPVIGGPADSGFEEIDYFKNRMYYSIFNPEEFVEKAKFVLSNHTVGSSDALIQTYFKENNSLDPIIDCIDGLI